MPVSWQKAPTVMATMIGQAMLPGPEPGAGGGLLLLDGVARCAMSSICGSLHAGELQNVQGLGFAVHHDQPARAARDEEEHEQEEQGGDAGDAELPAPLGQAELEAAEEEIGGVGEQDADDDVGLEDADEASAPLGRGDLGDVHGPEHGGAADGDAADEAEEVERVEAPGEGAADGGDAIEDGHHAEAVAAAVLWPGMWAVVAPSTVPQSAMAKVMPEARWARDGR